jgi:tetratricopeptide (TPR) repeat protein
METIIKDANKLKEEFDNLHLTDNLAYVKFYESNIRSIELIDINKDTDHYRLKLRLLCEYGISLVGAGRFTNGSDVLMKAIKMFENAPNQDSEKLKDVPYFEHLLWYYGIALWETKNIDSAIEIFNRLVIFCPENDKYRNWLNGLKANKIRKYTSLLWVICGFWLVGEYTFFDKFATKTHLIISIIGLVLLLTTISVEFYIYMIKRNKKRNHNRT